MFPLLVSEPVISQIIFEVLYYLKLSPLNKLNALLYSVSKSTDFGITAPQNYKHYNFLKVPSS